MAKKEEIDELEEEVDQEEVEEEAAEEETGKKKSKKTKKAKDEAPQAKVSPHFSEVIKAYLDNYASTDSAFNERYQNPDKNINDCCNYILNQVRKSGMNGFADEEIYKMARDYYVDEIAPEDTKAVSGKVVVNHQIELTEEEKEKARIEAIKKFEAECLEEERKKREAEAKALAKEEEKKAKKEAEKARKEAEKKAQEELKKAEAKAKGAGTQMSLFDMLGE